MGEAITLTYDVTLPKFLWKYLHRLFEENKHLTNEVINKLWNESGFSLLKGKGKASAVLKGIIERPKDIPSRIHRNVLEGVGRIIRSQIDRKEIFEELIELAKDENFDVKRYVKETGRNLSFVENVFNQVKNLKEKGRMLSYSQLSSSYFKGNVFLTSADDSVGNGQFKKLKVNEKFIELEIKLSTSNGNWKWFKAKFKTPKKGNRDFKEWRRSQSSLA